MSRPSNVPRNSVKKCIILLTEAYSWNCITYRIVYRLSYILFCNLADQLVLYMFIYWWYRKCREGGRTNCLLYWFLFFSCSVYCPYDLQLCLRICFVSFIIYRLSIFVQVLQVQRVYIQSKVACNCIVKNIHTYSRQLHMYKSYRVGYINLY